MVYVVIERLGLVLVDALLSIPPARFVIDDEALGPILMDALLPIPPVGLMYQVNVTGAGIDGCCAPNTASDIGSYCNYWGRY